MLTVLNCFRHTLARICLRSNKNKAVSEKYLQVADIIFNVLLPLILQRASLNSNCFLVILHTMILVSNRSVRRYTEE